MKDRSRTNLAIVEKFCGPACDHTVTRSSSSGIELSIIRCLLMSQVLMLAVLIGPGALVRHITMWYINDTRCHVNILQY